MERHLPQSEVSPLLQLDQRRHLCPKLSPAFLPFTSSSILASPGSPVTGPLRAESHGLLWSLEPACRIPARPTVRVELAPSHGSHWGPEAVSRAGDRSERDRSPSVCSRGREAREKPRRRLLCRNGDMLHHPQERNGMKERARKRRRRKGREGMVGLCLRLKCGPHTCPRVAHLSSAVQKGHSNGR